MSITPLIEIIHSATLDAWAVRNTDAFSALFGSPSGRYRTDARKAVALRAPEMSLDSGVPFAAYIHPSNSNSGAYSGLSFAIFPGTDHTCAIAMVVGTGGLTPDETILGRPGHARKVQAICSWLNQEFAVGSPVAWAKQDPTRTDIAMPENVRKAWPEYRSAFDRYGEEIYALYCPRTDRLGTDSAVTAFLDLLFEERGYEPLSNCQDSYQSIRAKWFSHLMPSVNRRDVTELLASRRYVVVQGPPGTGKTMMARELLHQEYGGHGCTIQFHPNTTYETFIGGLAPASSAGELGVRFAPTPGFLMQAAAKALQDPSRKYLLHIDEINRADLSKVLGEAIFLLEAMSNGDREIELPYDFGEPFHRMFFLPKNLHILGTMNSADRSIAIVDVAVRRRFAFVSLWPSMSVVERYGCVATQKAFRELVSIFVEHATEDAFPLLPGHSYFLESNQERAKQALQVNLAPLLEEYVAQGYVGGFVEPIRAYLQSLQSLT